MRAGHQSLVSFLCSLRAVNVNTVDLDDWTPLHEAAERNQVQSG